MAVFACVVYVRDILHGETRPDRVTWWILALLSSCIAATYRDVGAGDTIWLPVGYALGFAVIAVLSVRYGDGPFHLSALDRVCLGGALTSLMVWLWCDAAELALMGVVLVDFIALVPTLTKAYRHPTTESRAAWIVTTVAAALNLLAVTEWTVTIGTYPIYVFLTNLFATALLFRPGPRLAEPVEAARA